MLIDIGWVNQVIELMAKHPPSDSIGYPYPTSDSLCGHYSSDTFSTRIEYLSRPTLLLHILYRILRTSVRLLNDT